MKLLITRHDGFCFGVDRAIKKAEAALEEAQGEVYTLGEIIHNPDVVANLRQRGVKIANSPMDVPEGQTAVIRSHGVGKGVYDQANERGVRLIDATCPFVAKIHDIVQAHSRDGYAVAIVGNKTHPEVEGIVGWCAPGAEVLVVGDCDVAREAGHFDKLCVVAQTTVSGELFDGVVDILRGKADELKLFNSICETTAGRQSEAREIAKQSDAVFVIGGRNSSNTQKLEQICKKDCKNTFLIENADEVMLEKVNLYGIIGVVVGASTPKRIIMEVVTKMNELDKNTNVPAVENEVAVTTADDVAMQAAALAAQAQSRPETQAPAAAAVANEDSGAEVDFSEAFESTMVRIRNGQVLKGSVVQIADEEVCVNIGYKSDGFIPRNEFSSDPEVIPSQEVSIGDEIEVEVLKVNDGEGNVLLSRKSVESKLLWEKFLENAEEGAKFEIIPKEVVKGGIIGFIEGVRTFVPASHVAVKYVEKLDEFIGKPMMVKILEVDKAKRRVVASAKAAQIDEVNEKKKEIWGKLEVGAVIEGIVRRLTDFGAFVDIGGLDGLVHVTELAWGRVKHPADILKVGQTVNVIILSLDPEKDRISLGYKQLLPKPWATAKDRYEVGSIVEGKVVRIVPFGAFVALEPTIDGLVHISQIATKRVAKVEDELKIGDVIRCKVLDVNTEARRISLSRKEVLLEEQPPIEDIFFDEVGTGDASADTHTHAHADTHARDSRPPRDRDRDRPKREDVQIPAIEPATTSLADLFANITVE